MNNKCIAVFGVTGDQGRWVAESFQQRGWKVIGISRAGAKGTEQFEVRKADLERADEVAKATEGCDVVFGVTQPWSKDMSVDEAAEVRQTEGLVRGCHKSGVKHLIYSSVWSVERLTMTPELNMPHIRAKWNAYRLAHELGLPCTVLGPVHFMDNLAKFFKIQQGSIQAMTPPDCKVPYTSCRDIGEMAVVAAQMGPPEKRSDGSPNDGLRYLPVFSEFLSGNEVAQALAEVRAKGESFEWSAPPMFILRFFAPEMALTRAGFESVGYPPNSDNPKLTEQMHETRKLLDNKHWTMKDYLRGAGFDKKVLLPPPTPIWKHVALAAGVVAIAVGVYFYWK